MRRALVPTILMAALAACDDAPTGGTESDTFDQCGMSCDDDDVCTDDRCAPGTGRCVHVPRNALDACTMDRHCDDGDPCTTDSCGTDAECGLQRCQHTLVLGCRSCVGFVGCDDGDHCTTDVCGTDKLCRYTDEPTCDSRCRTWSVSTPGYVPVGQAVVFGAVEPRGGRGCTNACECAADLTLTDGYSAVSLRDAEGAWSCAIESACELPAAVSCAPLELGRSYVVWGEALADRDRAGAPIPADTAPQADVGAPPGQPASRLQVDGYCMAPTYQGVGGRYAGTLELDGEASVTFELMLDGNTQQWTVLGASGPLAGGTGYFEAWSGTSIAIGFVWGERYLRAELYPGADRLMGPVFDPSRAADAKPAIPGEPPMNQFGTPVGRMSLVLAR